MRLLFSFLLLLATAFGQAAITITDIGPTFAHLKITGFTGPCRWNLYDGVSASGTIHPDVVGILDTSKPDTYVDEYGARIMRMGHPWGDNALRQSHQYTIARDASDTGCAGVSPVTFMTSTPSEVTTRSFIPKWSSTSWNGIDGPVHDWSRAGNHKVYTAIDTGIGYQFLDQTGVFRGTTDLDYGGPGHNFDGVAGTWSNVGNLAAGSTSSYATIAAGDTSPAVLLPYILSMAGRGNGFTFGQFQPSLNGNGAFSYGFGLSLESMGVMPFGNCSGSGTDCQVQVCFSTNSSTGSPTCNGSGFTITLHNGSVVQESSGGPDPDGAFPAQYPLEPFQGWGSVMTRDLQPQQANIDHVTDGAVTIGNYYIWASNVFPIAAAGNWIVIPNNAGTGVCMSPTPCRVVSVTDAGHMNITDFAGNPVNLTYDQITQRASIYPFGILVKRVTAGSGTVNIGMKQKVVGKAEAGQTSVSYQSCGAAGPDDNGVIGRLCYDPKNALQKIYFISEDPSIAVYPVSVMDVKQYPGAGYVSGAVDWPSAEQVDSPIGFSPSQMNVIYASAPCAGNTANCVYKVTFRNVSDQSAALRDVFFTGDTARPSDFTPTSVAQAGNPLWECVACPSSGNDLDTKISANPNWAWTHQGIYDVYTGKWQVAGIAGEILFWYRWAYFGGNQDSWPDLIAAQYVGANNGTYNTGDVIKVFTMHYEGENGNIPEMRFGSRHNISVNPDVPNTVIISAEYPGGGANHDPNNSYLGPGVIMNVTQLKRNSGFSSDLSMAGYPYITGTASDYDHACPTAASMPAWVNDFITNPSNDCATLKVSSQICIAANPANNAKFTALGACSWNSGYTAMPWTYRVGDRFIITCDSCKHPESDAEPVMIASITDLGGGMLQMVVIRGANFDFACVGGSKSAAYPKANSDCALVASETQYPSSWVGKLIAGRNQSKGSTEWLVTVNPQDGSYQVAEEIAQFSGHARTSAGRLPGTQTKVSAVLTLDNAQLSDFGHKSEDEIPASIQSRHVGPSFSGSYNPYTQQYLQNSTGNGYEAQMTYDVNHINGGGSPGIASNPRNFTAIANCPGVYKVNATHDAGANWYKFAQLFGYSGHKVLEDISAPSGVNICNAHDYSMAYVMRATDDVGISNAANGYTPQVGDIFIKVNHLYTGGSGSGCPTQALWIDDACVTWLGPESTGGYRRFWSSAPDPTGTLTQPLIQMDPIFPGAAYFFSGSYASPSKRSALLLAGTIFDGIRNSALIVHLPPPMTPNTTVTNSLFNTTVSVPAVPGASYARTKFGLDPVNFYFTARKEAAVTDSVANNDGNPYAFIGDTGKSPYPCASGCTIPQPADYKRATYYRIQWLGPDGTTVVKESGTRIACPGCKQTLQ